MSSATCENVSPVSEIVVNQARHSNILSLRLKLEKLHVFVMVRNSVDQQRLTGEDGVLLHFAARIFFISVKIDPPDDQNQDILFFLA